MIINKKAENLVLTYCNLCGALVGGNGRMNLNINFDDRFPRSDELNTSISLNICPECSKKMVGMIEDLINKTEQSMVDNKIRIADQFNNISNSNCLIESNENSVKEDIAIADVPLHYSELENKNNSIYSNYVISKETKDDIISKVVDIIIESESTIDFDELFSRLETIPEISFLLKNFNEKDGQYNLIIELLDNNKIFRTNHNRSEILLYAETFLRLCIRDSSYTRLDNKDTNRFKRILESFAAKSITTEEEIKTFTSSVFKMLSFVHDEECLKEEMELITLLMKYNTPYRIKNVGDKKILFIPYYSKSSEEDKDINLSKEDEKNDMTVGRGRKRMEQKRG